MELVRLGNTELKVSRISFGGLPIQSTSPGEAEEAVRYAVKRGINFFDTARAYRTSEERLGLGLDGFGSRVMVATKTMYKDLDQLAEDFELSLKLLKRSYIDLFQFHIVNYKKELKAILDKNGPFNYLEEEQRKGRLRYIGITSHRPPLMLEAMASGRFASVQIPLNFIESGPLKKVIPYARENKVGIIAMKPLAGGVFRNRQAALRWVLQHENVVPIPGMCRVSEVDENLCALETPFGPEDLADLRQDQDELGLSFCRRCDYCMPCPNDIEASYIVRAGLMFHRSGWDKMERRDVELFIRGLSCTGCGECASRCPYNLPLTKMVIDESVKLLRKAHTLGLLSTEELEENLNRLESKN